MTTMISGVFLPADILHRQHLRKVLAHPLVFQKSWMVQPILCEVTQSVAGEITGSGYNCTRPLSIPSMCQPSEVQADLFNADI